MVKSLTAGGFEVVLKDLPQRAANAPRQIMIIGKGLLACFQGKTQGVFNALARVYECSIEIEHDQLWQHVHPSYYSYYS